jgi:hypothetical protein
MSKHLPITMKSISLSVPGDDGAFCCYLRSPYSYVDDRLSIHTSNYWLQTESSLKARALAKMRSDHRFQEEHCHLFFVNSLCSRLLTLCSSRPSALSAPIDRGRDCLRSLCWLFLSSCNCPLCGYHPTGWRLSSHCPCLISSRLRTF